MPPGAGVDLPNQIPKASAEMRLRLDPTMKLVDEKAMNNMWGGVAASVDMKSRFLRSERIPGGSLGELQVAEIGSKS
jgi:hypothetical protein